MSTSKPNVAPAPDAQSAAADTAAVDISPAEARAALDAGAGCLLDVRTDLEFDSEYVSGAYHVPLDALDRRLDEVLARGGPLYVLCRTGARAVRARERLTAAGVGDARVVAGGLEAWRAAGLDTVAGTPRMSLERQVRIAAGSLGLIGVVLGFLVHPGFFLLSGFVSAGLIFAGITDWCGMGLLLARMPWNRRRG
ncbi:MAG: rhodanese-like domain-containing protein [Planctomycetota bacterium]|jgi:rhodanese-related sulfurtransferase